MTILYLLNLLGFPLTLIFSSIYFTRYFRLDWLNPLTAVAGAFLPSALVTSLTGPAVILDGGLFNPDFQYAMLVNNVHETFSALTLIVIVRLFTRNRGIIRLTDRFARSGGRANPKQMRLAAFFFLGLYFLSFVLLAQHSFSVLQWIANPRIGYQLHRVGAGQWFALAITALSVSIVLMATYQRSTQTVLALSPFYIFLVYLLGSKGLILNFAVYLVIMLAIRQYRYFNVVALAVGVGAAALVALSLFSTLGSLDLSTLAAYSDGYTNAASYYHKYLRGELPLLNGQVFLSNFWGLVPRALYPNKPYIYGTTLIAEVFYPGAAEQTNTPAFATVIYFADFGWIGVLLSALFNPGTLLTAFLYSLVLPRLKLLNAERGEKHSLFLTYAFLLLAAPSFLLFFEFPNDALLFALIAGIVNASNRIRVRTTVGDKDRYPEPRMQGE